MSQFKPVQFYLLLSAVLLGWSFVFWPTLQSMEKIWQDSDTYTHCYLIPLISAWLLYDRRELITAMPRPTLLPLVAVIACCSIWLVGYIADINTLTHFSAIVSLQLLLLSLLGWKLGYQVAFPLFYLIFMVPFGDALNPPLQDITADASVLLLQWSGIPVLREGLYLTTPVGQFEVAEACSGLRFLIASLAIGAVFSYLTYQRWWKHLLFMCSIVLFSVVANCFRAFFLIWIGETSQMQYGFGVDHFIYGWFFFALVMFLMFWLGGKCADPQPSPLPSVNSVRPAPTLMVFSAGMTILILSFGMRFQISVTTTPDQPSAAAVPTGLVAQTGTSWQPGFFDGLKRLQAVDDSGVQYLFAQFGHKQDKGELIGWKNNLYQRRQWRVMQDQLMSVQDKPIALLELRNSSGDFQTLAFYYRVGSRQTTSELTAKWYQVQALLLNESSFSEVRAVLFTSRLADLPPAHLQRALAQLEVIH